MEANPLFFQRSGLLKGIVSKLKDADVNQDPLVILSGPEAAGKSMLAMMSVQSDDAIQLFSHGVTWLNFGAMWRQGLSRKGRQEKLLRILLREVQIICEGAPNNVGLETTLMYNAEDCKALIRMLVHERNIRLLLVLDDVDSIEDIAEFAYLGMIALVTSKVTFQHHEEKTIKVGPYLEDQDYEDLHTDFGFTFGDDVKKPVLELKLMMTMPRGVSDTGSGNGDVDVSGKEMLENYITSLNNIEERILLSLGYLDKNIPVSFELLTHMWNMDVSHICEMASLLLNMGCGHIGHGARTFFLHQEFYEVVYKLLHSKENFYYKTDVENSLRRYLLSESSFRDNIFESCELQQMLYFWESDHYNLDFVSDFIRLVDCKVDEALQIKDRSAENVSVIFETAENMCVLMKYAFNGTYKQTASEQLYELYNHKHNVLGDHHDVVEAFGKLYIHFVLGGTYLSDDRPRQARLLMSYVSMMVAAYGEMDMSVYPVIRSVAMHLSLQGFEEDSQQLFESVMSSSLFNSNKYSAPCVLFVEALFEILKSSGRHKDITKYALQMTEECPASNEYDVVRSRLLNCLASVYESRGKFNKARAIRESMASSAMILYGAKHPLTCDSLRSLAVLIEKQGKAPELVEPLLNQLYESWRCVYGVTNMLELRSIVLKLCDKKESKGEVMEAIELLKITLNDTRASTDDDADIDYGSILPLLEKLGMLYLGEGMHNDAVNILKRIVLIVDDYMGKNGQVTSSDAYLSKARAQFYIGSSYYSAGKINKALNCYKDSIDLFSSYVNENNCDEESINEFGKVHMCYGEALYKKGETEKFQTAMENLEKALELLKKNHLDDDPLLVEIGKLKKKIELHLSIRNRTIGSGDQNVTEGSEDKEPQKAESPRVEIERMDSRKIEKTLNIQGDCEDDDSPPTVLGKEKSDFVEDLEEEDEVDMYCSTFGYDYFYFSSSAKRSHNEGKDQATSLDELLKNDLIPVFVYGEHRQTFSKHCVLQAIEGISFVYTSSTVDLFAMVATRESATEDGCRIAIVKYERDHINFSKYHRPVCQIVGEVYLIPREGLEVLDLSYGEEYTRIAVKIRHSSGHFITAVTFHSTNIDAFDRKKCVRLPQGDFERFVDWIGGESEFFENYVPRTFMMYDD